MSIRQRLTLLIGLPLLALIGSLLALRQLEARQFEWMLADARRGRMALLDRWLDLTGDSLRRFADDCSRWAAMGRFVDHPDPLWPEANLGAKLTELNACAAWILDRGGSVIGAVSRPGAPAEPQPPVTAAAWPAVTASTPFPHFFAATPDGLLEVHGAPIRSPDGADPHRPARAWFLVAKLWDDSQLGLLSHLTDSEVRLADSGADPHLETVGGGTLQLARPLADWKGRTVRLLISSTLDRATYASQLSF